MGVEGWGEGQSRRFKYQKLECDVQHNKTPHGLDLGLRSWGLGFRVEDLGFRVWGSGFELRVQGLLLSDHTPSKMAGCTAQQRENTSEDCKDLSFSSAWLHLPS